VPLVTDMVLASVSLAARRVVLVAPLTGVPGLETRLVRGGRVRVVNRTGSVASLVVLCGSILSVCPGAAPAQSAAGSRGSEPEAARGAAGLQSPEERPARSANLGSATAVGRSTPRALPFTHVRSDDPDALALVAEAAAQSYTIGRLLDIIERSNVIAYVNLSPPPWMLPTSQTKLLAGRPKGYRYVSVWIDDHLWPDEQIQMLGHEFQHVVEIADAPEVVTDDDLTRLLRRIGYTSWNNRAFETYAAKVIQKLDSHELKSSYEFGESPADRVRLSESGDSHQQQLFGAYCAACHGNDGKGGGPAAKVMRVKLPDLTVLSKTSGGLFPRSRVEQCIRATDRQPPASIAEGMPVWRPVSSHETAAGPADHAQDIAAYLETLQRR
jgi:mono/diheme cytochrome c family protein